VEIDATCSKTWPGPVAPPALLDGHHVHLMGTLGITRPWPCGSAAWAEAIRGGVGLLVAQNHPTSRVNAGNRGEERR